MFDRAMPLRSESTTTRALPPARDRAARIAFWVGIPIALGLFSGWNQIGILAPALPLAWSMLYWLILSLILWAGLGLGTWIMYWLFKPAAPQLFMLAAGGGLGALLTRPVHAAYQLLFLPLTSHPEQIRTLPMLPLHLADWTQLATGNVMLLLFWVGGGLFFFLFADYAPLRGGRRPAPSNRPFVDVPAPFSRFAARLTRLTYPVIEVIRADDHYTCAMAPDGEELVLYRFADAAAELEGAGWLRVHRSYCVRRDRILSIDGRGRTAAITMQGGGIVPVSERYRSMVDRIEPSAAATVR
jgi:hypothetical protein